MKARSSGEPGLLFLLSALLRYASFSEMHFADDVLESRLGTDWIPYALPVDPCEPRASLRISQLLPATNAGRGKRSAAAHRSLPSRLKFHGLLELVLRFLVMPSVPFVNLFVARSHSVYVHNVRVCRLLGGSRRVPHMPEMTEIQDLREQASTRDLRLCKRRTDLRMIILDVYAFVPLSTAYLCVKLVTC
jgi:hypothetical protein